jgi:hypothetical protein
MATVRIPPVCALTGVPTEAVKKKSFAWTPGWTIFLLLGGLLPYIVVALLLRKRMTVRLPLREGKHGHWMVRQAFLIIGVFFSINLFLVGGMVAGKYADERITGIVVMLGILLLLFTLIAGVVLTNKSIRPLEITDDEMRLSSVHPNFKEALEAMRKERWRAADARDAEAAARSDRVLLMARRYDGE